MKDGSYVINFDEYKSLGIHWVNLCHNGNAEAGFESFGNEFIHNEIRTVIKISLQTITEHTPMIQ